MKHTRHTGINSVTATEAPAHRGLWACVYLCATPVRSALHASAFVILLLYSSAYAAQFSVEGFSTETIAGGLTLPTAAAFHTDGRIFIAQKNGVVRVVDNGILLPTPFIELAKVNNYRDRGLLGIAIDPDFDTNGFVYLAYTYENDESNPTGP
ncbi:MAG: PQQ-dependent sugar dehydrogenase, partial [Pseudomonadota bacterium]